MQWEPPWPLVVPQKSWHHPFQLASWKAQKSDLAVWKDLAALFLPVEESPMGRRIIEADLWMKA